MIGILLFTLGSLIPHFLSFNGYSIVTLILQALPIIGFWLIFAASKSRKLPEKTLPALTLFKVSVIINLVVMCLVFLLLLLVSVLMIVGGSMIRSYIDIDIVTSVGIILLVITAVVLTFVLIYFSAILRVLNGIRRNIIGNIIKPIRGVNTFSVFIYIFIGISILSALVSFFALSAVNNYISEIFSNIPNDFSTAFEQIIPSTAQSTLSGFLTLATNVGTILCVATLNRFNGSIARKKL